jgi:hypothetical protein
LKKRVERKRVETVKEVRREDVWREEKEEELEVSVYGSILTVGRIDVSDSCYEVGAMLYRGENGSLRLW